MPTYEYSCNNCGRFEIIQKISEDPLKTCPKCGAEVQRLIAGGAGIIFKGSGFYTTDYRSNGDPNGRGGGDGGNGTGSATDKAESGSDSDS